MNLKQLKELEAKVKIANAMYLLSLIPSEGGSPALHPEIKNYMPVVYAIEKARMAAAAK